jgi:hypothetical protein
MRYIWTNAGDDPDVNQGNAFGIDGYFMPAFDSITTKEYLRDEIAAKGKQPGFYIGAGWLNGLTPAQYAAAASAEYARLTVPGLKVQFNLEEHTPERIASIFEEWRKLRPSVGTSWSLEGFQGGWMDSSFVARVVASKIRVVPECFVDEPSMNTSAADMVLRDLVARGFPISLVTCMYDAANLPKRWDGFAFIFGRLPL